MVFNKIKRAIKEIVNKFIIVVKELLFIAFDVTVFSIGRTKKGLCNVGVHSWKVTGYVKKNGKEYKLCKCKRCKIDVIR